MNSLVGACQNVVMNDSNLADTVALIAKSNGQANHACRMRNHPNPLARFGRHVFSQTDEDGITIEIIRRLGLRAGYFLEYGAGEGTQNNTLVLLALGWSGVWVDGTACGVELPHGSRVHHEQRWVTRDNVAEIARDSLALCGANSFDVVSMDMDGNDYYFVEQLLGTGHRPDLFIVETVPLPPPIEFKIDYDPDFVWSAHEFQYVGASLTAYDRLFSKYGYTLVCCNTGSGANAFFVLNTHAHEFRDVPSSISEIYAEPASDLLLPRSLHPPASKRLVAHLATDSGPPGS